MSTEFQLLNQSGGRPRIFGLQPNPVLEMMLRGNGVVYPQGSSAILTTTREYILPVGECRQRQGNEEAVTNRAGSVRLEHKDGRIQLLVGLLALLSTCTYAIYKYESTRADLCPRSAYSDPKIQI